MIESTIQEKGCEVLQSMPAMQQGRKESESLFPAFTASSPKSFTQ